VRPVIHLALHVLVPWVAARMVFPDFWKRAFLIMAATMVIGFGLLIHIVLDSMDCIWMRF
jgi:hypothetical protein